MTPRHFTAWLVNDLSALDQPNMDVTVLEDEVIAIGPEGTEGTEVWGSAGKPAAFYAVTGVDARDGDAEQGCDEAEAKLRAAGWQLVGGWEAVDNAYVATVERDED